MVIVHYNCSQAWTQSCSRSSLLQLMIGFEDFVLCPNDCPHIQVHNSVIVLSLKSTTHDRVWSFCVASNSCTAFKSTTRDRAWLDIRVCDKGGLHNFKYPSLMVHRGAVWIINMQFVHSDNGRGSSFIIFKKLGQTTLIIQLKKGHLQKKQNKIQ